MCIEFNAISCDPFFCFVYQLVVLFLSHLSKSFSIRFDDNLFKSFGPSFVVRISNVFCHCVSITLCKRSAISLLLNEEKTVKIKYWFFLFSLVSEQYLCGKKNKVKHIFDEEIFDSNQIHLRKQECIDKMDKFIFYIR